MIKNKKEVIGTLMVSTAMASIDRSIVNVSLPSIRADFGVEINQIEWVVTAYMLTFLVSIPLINWLKNAFGYYRLLVACLLVFTLGSLLCSIAQSLPLLVAARVVQAAAGGTITPMSMAILSEYFPPEERGSAIGWWGMGNVMGPAIGPTIGGVLTHFFGWPSVFYINIPVGLAALFFVTRYMSFLKEKPVHYGKFDKTGYLLFIAFVIGMQLWVSSLSTQGIFSLNTTLMFAVTLAALYAFVRSASRPGALLDLGVFRHALFNRAAVVIFIRSVALFGGMFYLPFLLQGQLGFSEMEAGMLMLPNALLMLVVRPYAGKMADKGAIRNTSIVGIVLVALSFTGFAFLEAGTGVLLIVALMALRGTGMGLLVAPVSTALVNAVEPRQAATATAMNSLLLQLGGSLGIAASGVCHTLMSNAFRATMAEAEAEHRALQGSFAVAAIGIALALLPAWRLPVSAPVQTESRPKIME